MQTPQGLREDPLEACLEPQTEEVCSTLDPPLDRQYRMSLVGYGYGLPDMTFRSCEKQFVKN